MKDKIDQIFTDLKNEVITEKAAHNRVLLLFSVSGRSEQVCPCGKLIKRYRPTPCPTNGITYCEDCIGQTYR